MMLDKKLLTAGEAANVLGCPVYMVYDFLHRGLLVGFKYETSKAWRIPEDSVQNFISQRVYNASTPQKI